MGNVEAEQSKKNNRLVSIFKLYKDRLEKAGFAVSVEQYVSDLPAANVMKYGPERTEDIHLRSKPMPQEGESR